MTSDPERRTLQNMNRLAKRILTISVPFVAVIWALIQYTDLVNRLPYFAPEFILTVVHFQKEGEVELGFSCSTANECASGHCYPGPTGMFKFCIVEERNCGFPGDEGRGYSDPPVTFGLHKWQCSQPVADGKQAYWRIMK